MKRLLSLATLALSSCGGADVVTPPAPPPAVVRFSETWEAPDIGLACSEDVPPVCQGASRWLTFDREGTQGRVCTTPFSQCVAPTVGGMSYHADAPGWPIFTNRAFAGAMSMEATLSATLTAIPDAYSGPVIYNGEMNYRALYYVQAPGGLLQVAMFAPHFLVTVGPETYNPGSMHALRIDYDAGVWNYYVDGVLKLTEPATGLGVDGTLLLNDPHASMFWGGADGVISSVVVR